MLAALLPCVLILFLAGCAPARQHGVRMSSPEDNPYAQAVGAMLPGHEISALRDGAFRRLEAGAAAEAYGYQAHSALKAGVAEHWYPHYLATAVIAVDRDRTAADIGGWGDLLACGEAVGFYEKSCEGLLLCAMAYGLEGDGYGLGAAANLLEGLSDAGRLKDDSLDAPVIICLDDRAAQMIREGRNLEIVVPREGTLTYQKGLLSPEPLAFAGDAERALLFAGLRLMDGRCEEGLYPAAAAYAPASEITDMDHFLAVSLETTRTLRRDVRHVRLYTGADAREHQAFALIYIVAIAIWTASLVRRAMQSGVRRGALAVCAILLAWITVRLVKYQTSSLIYWDRFLWFSFLGFQLMLMYTLLVMAWSIDAGRGAGRTPKWLRALGALNILLALIVLTNDLHGWVYVIDYGSPSWRSDYGYAAGYHIITALYMAEFIIANIMLLMKSIRRPGKRALVFPLALCVVILVYRWGYIARVPLMWESDLTTMTGVFALLFFEAAIRAGMIPVNTKYAAVFSHSTLGMQILDGTGAVALASASATPIDERSRAHVLSGAAAALATDESSLLYSSAITGGYAVWQEDVSGINRLHRETQESVRRLEAANALLAQEEKIKRQLDEEAAKRQLAEKLEGEIAEKTAQLTRMIDALDTAENQPLAAARVALLLCYIKRRCNLFFRERETDRLPVGELAVYIDELSELAGQAGVKTASASMLAGDLPVRRATLFYDFFYETAAWAAAHDCTTMLAHIGAERGAVTMRLTLSASACDYRMDEGLDAAIKAAGGVFLLKDLGDAAGISLSFPEGGEAGA